MQTPPPGGALPRLFNRLRRGLRHLRWDERHARRALPAEAVARIGARVTASEQAHSGQIRVCVEAALPPGYLWRDLPPRARAITLFGKLRVWDTAANNGVLVYLLLAERAVEIVADRGLNAVVDAAGWQRIIDGMRPALAAGRFEQGLAEAVGAIDALLRQHHPRQAGEVGPNELPDAVDLR